LGYVLREEVRALTGVTEVEVGDFQLDRIIAEAESLIGAYTGRSWSPSDEGYSRIQTAARFLAASLVYESLPSTPEVDGKAQRYHERAMLVLRAMRVLDSGPLRRV